MVVWIKEVGVGGGRFKNRESLLYSRIIDIWKESLKVKPFNPGTDFCSK